jgi:hypothetical protein
LRGAAKTDRQQLVALNVPNNTVETAPRLGQEERASKRITRIPCLFGERACIDAWDERMPPTGGDMCLGSLADRGKTDQRVLPRWRKGRVRLRRTSARISRLSRYGCPLPPKILPALLRLVPNDAGQARIRRLSACGRAFQRVQPARMPAAGRIARPTSGSHTAPHFGRTRKNWL